MKQMAQRLGRLSLLLLAPAAHARVLGVWTDIEGLAPHENMVHLASTLHVLQHGSNPHSPWLPS